jgi:predicted transcriptional regulator
MEEHKKTQQERILDYIRKNDFITSLDASRLFIMDLQGQIQALEDKGYKFDKVRSDDGRYKKYYLIKKEQIL